MHPAVSKLLPFYFSTLDNLRVLGPLFWLFLLSDASNEGCVHL